MSSSRAEGAPSPLPGARNAKTSLKMKQNEVQLNDFLSDLTFLAKRYRDLEEQLEEERQFRGQTAQDRYQEGFQAGYRQFGDDMERLQNALDISLMQNNQGKVSCRELESEVIRLGNENADLKRKNAEMLTHINDINVYHGTLMKGVHSAKSSLARAARREASGAQTLGGLSSALMGRSTPRGPVPASPALSSRPASGAASIPASLLAVRTVSALSARSGAPTPSSAALSGAAATFPLSGPNAKLQTGNLAPVSPSDGLFTPRIAALSGPQRGQPFPPPAQLQTSGPSMGFPDPSLSQSPTSRTPSPLPVRLARSVEEPAPERSTPLEPDKEVEEEEEVKEEEGETEEPHSPSSSMSSTSDLFDAIEGLQNGGSLPGTSQKGSFFRDFSGQVQRREHVILPAEIYSKSLEEVFEEFEKSVLQYKHELSMKDEKIVHLTEHMRELVRSSEAHGPASTRQRTKTARVNQKQAETLQRDLIEAQGKLHLCQQMLEKEKSSKDSLARKLKQLRDVSASLQSSRQELETLRARCASLESRYGELAKENGTLKSQSQHYHHQSKSLHQRLDIMMDHRPFGDPFHELEGDAEPQEESVDDLYTGVIDELNNQAPPAEDHKRAFHTMVSRTSELLQRLQTTTS